MPGQVLVPYPENRQVFIDNSLCGNTNAPFAVEVGTHDIDLGEPIDYVPHTRKITVKSTHTSLKPLKVNFTPEDEE